MQREVIDARGPTRWHGESLALRKRVLASINSGLARNVGPIRRHPVSPGQLYAEALGVPVKEAAARADAQAAHLAAFQPDPVVPTRRQVYAKGPTNWERDTEAKRLRARILATINRRVQVGYTKAEWLSLRNEP